MIKLVVGGAFILGVIIFSLLKYARVGFSEGSKAVIKGFKDAYEEVFDEEKLSNTKIITLALHPHIVGVPQNFHYFKKTIQELKKRDDVTFMTSSQIGDWFIKEEGTNGEALIPYLNSPPN